MLATAGTPPEGEGWAVEFKWDGVRAIVAVADGRAQITSRLGNDVTAGYPEVSAAGLGGGRSLLLDGELVALDAAGRPDSVAAAADAPARTQPADPRCVIPPPTHPAPAFPEPG